MQTKKRAKPVKFGKAARDAEQKAKPAEEPKVEKVEEAAPAAEAPATKETKEAPQAESESPTPETKPQGGELVDKLSDVPFETDFGTPSETPASSAPTAATPSEPAAATPTPVEFSATSTNPVEQPSTTEAPKTDASQPVAAPIDVNPESSAIPPIGRSNEPIPFNPHETVFNTPPDAGEKKKNPFLYFLIIAFVAFVTGIAFMAGIYYAMPDKSFFAMPTVPAVPGVTEPTPTTAPSAAQPTVTSAPEVKLADYSIRVLNGSGISGQAAKVKAALEAEGFTVTAVGNADRTDVTKTQIVYKKTVSKDALTKLKTVLGKTYALEKETELPTSASQTNDILITIGKEAAK